MNPRRVLILSLNYYPKFIGGAEVAIKEITDRIPESNIQFDMITMGDGRGVAEEKMSNVNVYRIFFNIGLFQKLLFPFKAHAKAEELNSHKHYDTIWCMMASYAGYAGYLFKKRNPKTKFLLSIQEGEHFGRRSLLSPLFGRIFKAADSIQVISNFLADWARRRGATCPIKVVPNGVDYELFAKKVSDSELATIKSKLGKNRDDIFLVTTSRLVPKNAVNDIISSLSQLPPNFKLLIIGRGPDEAKLKVQVSKLNLSERVTFLGYIPHASLPPYLQASDIFVRPSLTEGLGNSFLEAMAAGLPVIATPVGGIPDFLKDGETGLFCEVRNPRSIAQKVLKLSRDKESCDYMVKQAQKMVQEKYGWERAAGEMKGLFGLTIES
ncbi:MAG: glycosyltransferase family 4 protein [Candidatus Paceibacterota bacterium]